MWLYTSTRRLGTGKVLHGFNLEPTQRTKLCLPVPSRLRSALCVHVLMCLTACAGNAAADAGSQCSSAAGFPGQAQGVRVGKAAAAAAVCDFCSCHSCKQCRCCCGCGGQVSAWAAGAAGSQGRDGMPPTSKMSAAASLMQYLLPTAFACSELPPVGPLHLPSKAAFCLC